MDRSDSDSIGTAQTARVAGQVLLALVACFLAAPWSRPEPRGRSVPAGWSAADTALILAPAESADITAAPDVTTPSASVARFSIWPLPVVATVLDPTPRGASAEIEGLLLRGRLRGGEGIKAGQKLQVEVAEVDPGKGLLELKILGPAAAEPADGRTGC